MRSVRTYTQDRFPSESGSSSQLPSVARSVIVAAVLGSQPTEDDVTRCRQLASRVIAVPVAHAADAVLADGRLTTTDELSRGDEETHRLRGAYASVCEVGIESWDATYGHHRIDLVDAPRDDETVLLVRLCGITVQEAPTAPEVT